LLLKLGIKEMGMAKKLLQIYILSIFVALLTFYTCNKEKKKKISHFKMPTLNSDVTVNSYNNPLFEKPFIQNN
jgi:hypothetical protein